MSIPISLNHIHVGDRINHKLGKSLIVLKVTKHSRGKIPNHKTVTMVKCRYIGADGMFHTHEFFPEELSRTSTHG